MQHHGNRSVIISLSPSMHRTWHRNKAPCSTMVTKVSLSRSAPAGRSGLSAVFHLHYDWSTVHALLLSSSPWLIHCSCITIVIFTMTDPLLMHYYCHLHHDWSTVDALLLSSSLWLIHCSCITIVIFTITDPLFMHYYCHLHHDWSTVHALLLSSSPWLIHCWCITIVIFTMTDPLLMHYYCHLHRDWSTVDALLLSSSPWLIHCSCITIVIFLDQVRLRTDVLHTLKFDWAGVQTHDLQIMTVHFMSLTRCSNHLTISDFYACIPRAKQERLCMNISSLSWRGNDHAAYHIKGSCCFIGSVVTL